MVLKSKEQDYIVACGLLVRKLVWLDIAKG